MSPEIEVIVNDKTKKYYTNFLDFKDIRVEHKDNITILSFTQSNKLRYSFINSEKTFNISTSTLYIVFILDDGSQKINIIDGKDILSVKIK
jgi:hypothetical protein